MYWVGRVINKSELTILCHLFFSKIMVALIWIWNRLSRSNLNMFFKNVAFFFTVKTKISLTSVLGCTESFYNSRIRFPESCRHTESLPLHEAPPQPPLSPYGLVSMQKTHNPPKKQKKNKTEPLTSVRLSVSHSSSSVIHALSASPPVCLFLPGREGREARVMLSECEQGGQAGERHPCTPTCWQQQPFITRNEQASTVCDEVLYQLHYASNILMFLKHWSFKRSNLSLPKRPRQSVIIDFIVPRAHKTICHPG